MKRKQRKWKWKKKIMETTLDVFAAPIDFVLFSALVMLAVSRGPDTMQGMSYRLSRLLDEGDERIVRNALRNCKQRRWFKKDYTLTAEGQRRLKKVLPELLPAKHWDGVWYVVSYDIPEKMHKKRDALRDNLKHLGFGQLQKSSWISPVNYLGAVEEVVSLYQLKPYVILSEANKMGDEASRELANRVWELDRLNNEYTAFIEYWKKINQDKSVKDKEKIWPVIRYFSVLKRDPQLPEDLLPDDWHGFEAHEIMNKFFKKELKGRLNGFISQGRHPIALSKGASKAKLAKS